MSLGPRRLAAFALTLLALTAGALPVAAAPRATAPSRATAGGNPFTAYRWGTYAGPLDFTWLPYTQASGRRRAVLRYLIDQPKAKWFGHWMPDAVLAGLAARRPDLADPGVLVPVGWDALVAAIDRFVAVGTSKFVIVPMVEPDSPDAWVRHLTEAAQVVRARTT